MYRVLIVDDEAIICQGLRSKLKRINNSKINDIIECYSAYEAIEIIGKDKPDIVITDVKMPGMSGIELIEKIVQENQKIKFIVLSGYDDYQYVRKAFKNGAVDYILKPASISELRERINAVIHTIEVQEHARKQKNIMERKTANYQVKQLIEKIIHINHENQDGYAELKKLYPYEHTMIAILYRYRVLQIPWTKDEVSVLFEEQLKTVAKIQYAYFYNHKDNLVILFNFQKKEDQTILKNVLRKLMASLRKKTSQYICSISSCNHQDIYQVKELYFQAREALSYKIMYEPYQMISYDQISKYQDTKILQQSDMNDLDTYIQHKDFYKLSHYINQSFTYEKLQNISIVSIEKLFHIILQKIKQLFNHDDLMHMDHYNKLFHDFESLTDIRVYLKQCMLCIQKEVTQNDSQVKSVVDIAIQYV